MQSFRTPGRRWRARRRGPDTNCPRSWTRVVTATMAATMVAFTVGAWGTAMAQTADASCQPGSGPHLAGKTLTSSDVSNYSPGHLRCADLSGADMSGLSLIQVDLTGAILRNANLQNTDLTQATLDGADLSHANLSNAKLDQASAHNANFGGANLTSASMVQTDLTGASLNGASLGGVSFTEATLTGTTFTGATGVTPWSFYLLIASGLLFLLLAVGTISRARRPGGPRSVILALLGGLVAAFGFHLFAGGLIDEFLGGFGTPVTQTCTGPLCTVGVGSGTVGIFAGIILLLIGLGMRRSRGLPSTAGGITGPYAGTAAGPYGGGVGGPYGGGVGGPYGGGVGGPYGGGVGGPYGGGPAGPYGGGLGPMGGGPGPMGGGTAGPADTV